MRMLDLFAGELGWSSAFAARGHECICVDLNSPRRAAPENCKIVIGDILGWEERHIEQLGIDFICASSPCEGFSVWGMRHFHPKPPYPELAVKLFNHTRSICEDSGVPYVMENVRAAQQFVGDAVNHCGPFYLWGSGVPPLIPKNILKGRSVCRAMLPNLYAKIINDPDRIAKRKEYLGEFYSPSKAKTARAATIPPELAASVVDYAERLLEASVK